MTTTTADAFTRNARAVFTQAGGDPENAAQLAAWARDARRVGDENRGVLVSRDGDILAETRHHGRGNAHAHYVTSVTLPEAGDQVDREVGLASARLCRLTGRDVMHVRYWSVCSRTPRP